MANKNKMVQREHFGTKDSRPASSTPPPTPKAADPPIETQEVASSDVLRQLAKKIQKALLNEEHPKVSLAEYLKLVQLIKDTEGEQLREITVRWVDPLWVPDNVA